MILLQNNNAIVYGAGGSLSGALAKELAATGARIVMTRRKLEKLLKLKEEILSTGGKAEADVVHALNEDAIKKKDA